MILFSFLLEKLKLVLHPPGGGLSAGGDPDSAKLGKNLAMAGLVLQLVSLVLYIGVVVIFGFRV